MMKNKFHALAIVVLSAMLLVTLGFSLTRSNTAQAQSPTQWEYKTVRLLGVANPDGTFGAKGNIIEDGSASTTKMLNDLGAQGWELVSFTSQGLGDVDAVLIFKKQK